MTQADGLDIAPSVRNALTRGTAVVALESTIISHGLPWPLNRDLAIELEDIIRQSGAVAATLGICDGRITVGMSEDQITAFARGSDILKVSRADIATAVTQGKNGATTVAATMICAQMAGIRVFATGGIGGVHRGAETSFDISADLEELASTPVAVVCAGAKSILDLPKTLEYLETKGVPVIGYKTGEFPAFHSRESGLNLVQRSDSISEMAHILKTRDRLGPAGGELIANPVPEADEIQRSEIDNWIGSALTQAGSRGVQGKDVTPFLLARLAELSDGRTVKANLALVRNNARLAAEIAVAYANLEK